MKLDNEMVLHFKNTNYDIISTEQDEKHFRNVNICRFCERNKKSDKVRDYCHLANKYRGPAHSNCKINVTQKQCNFIPVVFHNFSIYDCHLFFKKLVGNKNDEVKFDIIPETNEEYISVTYGCIRLTDNYRFLSSSLDSLGKTFVPNSHKTLEKLKKKLLIVMKN